MTKNRKKNNVEIIAQNKTSVFIFFIPTIILIVNIYQLLIFQHPSIIFLILSLVFFIPFFLNFYKKRIILTKNKIYVMSKKKKIISWHLMDDCSYIQYEQSFLGKIFNYGTLQISNNKNQFYQYLFLHDIKNFYNKVLEQYNKIKPQEVN
jgi:hypothetical protein